MFKSLLWRLHIWHTIVLLVVLTSFGAIVHQLHWKTRLAQIDAELNRVVGPVSWEVRRLMPRLQGPRPPRGRDDARPEGDQRTRPGENQATQPPATQTPGTPPSPAPEQPAQALPTVDATADTTRAAPNQTWLRSRTLPESSSLPADIEQLFKGDEDSRLYFAVWNEQGELVLTTEGAPSIPYPNFQPLPDGQPARTMRERKGEHVYRELVQATRGRDGRDTRNMVIGRSMEKDLAAYHQSGMLLVVTGLVILGAGMLGGGWLSARAIRPIAAMTAAAESISAQNLSGRINVKETDSELGNLAAVLNQTFDRLQSAFEQQQQFTADASHELRTPLSVIATHTELALARPRSNEDYRGALETCQRASQKMRALIDALLVLARFEGGAPQTLKHDQLDLEPLIQDCVELVRSLADERGIQIDCQSSKCEVIGDWDRLSQVVTNLLTNAIRYNVEGGQVTISTRVEGGSAVISVTDTGIGIAKDQLPHIFDRFYQVDKARSRAEGSSGLGLSIVKTIVNAHGGTIAATSRPDFGTTIEVRLPLTGRAGPVEKIAANEELLVAARSDS